MKRITWLAAAAVVLLGARLLGGLEDADSPSAPAAPLAGSEANGPSVEVQDRAFPARTETQVDSLAMVQAPESCSSRVGPAHGNLAVGSWNLRWFPRGISPSETEPKQGTDIERLACAIAQLKVSVLAVQEVLDDAVARRGQQSLIEALDRLTGGSHRLILDSCGPGAQHVGFLYDEARVRLLSREVLDEVNPAGSACAARLRPGLLARFQPLDGSAAFSLVTVHLDSGVTERDFRHRQLSMRSLQTVAERLRDREPLVVLGDFNTMGCETCQPAVTAEAEQAQLESLSPLRWLGDSVTPCTHYYRGQAGWLDHALASLNSPPLALTVHGPCEVLACSRQRPPSSDFMRAVSDHCPLRVSFLNLD